MVIGLPALEESPRIRISNLKGSLFNFGGELVDLNGRLAFAAHAFAHDHPDATVFFFDNLHHSIMTRNDVHYYPETSGIKREEGYCYFYADRKEVVEDDDACHNPLREFYWRDETHHTEPFHKLMARLMVEQMKDTTTAMPYEFY